MMTAKAPKRLAGTWEGWGRRGRRNSTGAMTMQRRAPEGPRVDPPAATVGQVAALRTELTDQLALSYPAKNSHRTFDRQSVHRWTLIGPATSAIT
jgi:hypothetical protein